ncbi:GIY-YIG nuclease family protein [Bacillus cereus]|nr:GIY-YIG nuclease family protein [Bacillus cereus]MDA2555078.1 GIY-YIG nuclease family protein [Bacillus cereus]
MFGTIIQDAYTKDETKQIAEALEDLCNPHQSYGWSSAGIYSFWNYTTKEVLYIGLAVDLLERFKQHNGIIRMEPKGCKFEKIQEYFKTQEKIGYSIFVQSSHHQPVTKKNKAEWERYDELQFPFTQYPKDDIKIAEGILIQTYKMHHGVLPPWNQVGGSKEGQKEAKAENYIIVENLKYQNSSPLTARHTLREISKNATFLVFEEFLHAVRMKVLMGMSFNNALETFKIYDKFTYDRIIEEKYLNHNLSF